MDSGAPTPPGSRWTRWKAARRLQGWPVDAWSGFLGGLLASSLLLAVLTWQAGWVADLTLGANPTCAAPRGLRQVAVADARAGSTQAKVADGNTGGVVSTDPGSHYVARFAVDDASNTVWIPEIVNDLDEDGANEPSREPEFLTADGANELTLTLDERADVRLVCVVNGSGLWYTSYQNFGRVRSVQVWGDDDDDKELGILQSLGSEDFPNTQVAGRNLGDTRTIHLELVDAYAGIQVENYNARACLDGATVEADRRALDEFIATQRVRLAPDVLYRWPDGCILEPKVKAGIAEVRVYATD